MNLAFLAPTLPTTLLSLGFLQRHGVHYCPDPTRPLTHCLISALGLLLNCSTLSPTNLLPIDFAQLYSTALHHPTLFPPQTTLPAFLLTNIPPTTPHVTHEQRTRANQAEALHHALGHPSDDTLSLCIATGKIPTSLISSDIKLNRTLRGHCVHCAAGKYRAPPHPSSTSPPATRPGQRLSFDPQLLPHPSPGGFTHEIIVIDEHSGYMSVIGSFSKHTPHVFQSLQSLITTLYNANNHQVSPMHSDSENVNISLASPLGSLGITLTTSLPGEHAHRAERYIQTLRATSAAMASPLPYYLPNKYILYLHQAAAAARNNLICSQSDPYTPSELLRHTILKSIPLPFGTSALVIQHLDKRRSQAVTHTTTTSTEPKTELGVCLGPHITTGHSLFVLANGRIVPRRPYQLLPSTYVPFDWPPKPHVLHVSITPPSSTSPLPADSDHYTCPPIPTTTPSTLNHPPQLPHLPLPLAIAATTSHIPSPFPAPLLHSLNTGTPLSLPLHPSPPALPTPTSNTLPLLPTISTPLPQPLPPPPPYPNPSPPPPPPTPPLPPPPLRTSARIAANPLPPGIWHGASFLARTNAITTKLANARAAAARNRLFNSLHPSQLTNHPTALLPTPDPARRAEMTIARANITLPPPDIAAAINKETTKHLTKYCSLRLISPTTTLETRRAFLRSKMLIKQKSSGLVTARLAIDGSQQPPDSYTNTFAGTSDATNRSFLIAVTLADAAHRCILPQLIIGSYDITAAFLQSALPRSTTGGYQLLTRLPLDLPNPLLAGRTAEITGACYGLKQSNNVFDQDIIALHVSNGYLPTASDHHTFRKVCPLNPSNSVTINLHVDDGFYVSSSSHLLSEYKAILLQRYGPIDFNDHCTSICGMSLTRHSDHSITLDYGAHIQKFLTKAGMDHLPPALSPSLPTFFNVPDNPAPANQALFQRINGSLLFYLPLRADCRKEIIHLCTKNHNPSLSDHAHQLQLLRYLKGHPHLGPTFTALPSNHPSGVLLTASADASHACHPDGASHAAFIISVGTNTAPFLTYSAREKGISLSPCETEYKTLSRCAQDVVFYRQFAADLGHPQLSPTTILEDNKSAIKLATAPAVTRHSRHINIKHHYLRWLTQTNQVDLLHQGTNDIIPDGLTKYLPPSAFPYFRATILNLFHPSDTLPPSHP